jgi:N-carbamoyl-L-amino-acid hydrolase
MAGAGVPAAAVGRLAARLRLQGELTGRADHAGTTRREERHDALAAAARLIVLGDDLAAERAGMLFTATRIEVEPNAPTTVASRARLWLDARAAEAATVEGWREAFEAAAGELAGRSGAEAALRTAAWSPGTEFAAELVAAVADGVRAASGAPAPAPLVCYAGHDAGVIAGERPAGMVLVRNPTGISHAPAEEVSLDDAAVAANALLAALDRLA